MNRIICNECRTEAPPRDPYNLPPIGWFGVTSYAKTTPHAAMYEVVHLCGAHCLAAWGAEELRLQQAEQAAVDEAAREAVTQLEKDSKSSQHDTQAEETYRAKSVSQIAANPDPRD